MPKLRTEQHNSQATRCSTCAGLLVIVEKGFSLASGIAARNLVTRYLGKCSLEEQRASVG